MHHIKPALFPIRRRLVVALTLVAFLIVLVTSAAAQGDDGAENAVALFNQAQDLHEKGDIPGAIALYIKALKAEPNFPEAEYQRGMAELAAGNDLEAEKAFRRAVALRPEWSLAVAKLGETLVNRLTGYTSSTAPAEQASMAKEAGDVLSKALETDPNNFPAMAALIDLRLYVHAPDDVLKDMLEKVRALTDGKSGAPAMLWAARAAIETRLGNVTAARASLRAALAVDPVNKPALIQSADIAVADGDMARAKEIAKRLEPSMAATDTYKLLNANIMAQDGRPDEALKLLDQIVHPSPAATDLRKRITANNIQSPAELEKLLESNPKDAAILGRLCILYRRDAPAKALTYCRQASEAEPNNIKHAIGFGAALVQAKQFETAVGLFKKILTLAPDNSTVHANLATALFELKRYAEARAEYAWLINAQPKSAAAYFFLAIVYDQLGEYMDAMANYQQYLRLADPVENKLEIDKVNLRLPILQRQIKDGKGKKNG